MRDTQSTMPSVAVIGAGLMGHGIAQSFMTAGAEVAIWDPSPEALASVPERVASHLELLGEKHPITLRLATGLADAVAGVDLVVEAAPEQVPLKQDLLRQVEEVNPDAIFASNTSVLRITEIAQQAAHPGRVIGTHWWNPPYLIPLVEVVRGERTATETVERVSGWLTAIGKTPVEVFKDVPGFVGNRMQFALVREAAYIVEQGVCSPETVDTVARLTFGRRWGAVGPLQNSDFIGLDLVKSILDYLGPSLSTAQAVPALFQNLIDEGRTGAKAGTGLYDWPPGEREAVEHRLLAHLIRQAQSDQGEQMSSQKEQS